MSEIFSSIVRGSFLKTHMRVTGELNKDFFYGHDYSYIQCPVGYSSKKHCEPGDIVQFKPSITVNPTKCKLFIVPNGQLNEVATLSYQPVLDTGDGEQLRIYATFNKKFEVKDLEWLLRIYAVY